MKNQLPKNSEIPINPDATDPAELFEYYNDPSIKQQIKQTEERLFALVEQKDKEYLERQRIAEEAEKRGEVKGELKTLMSLLLEHIIGIDVVKHKLNAKTDAEVEKKIQEIFPDFQLPAHS